MDGYSGAGVSESEKAKPPPRSHQPRPPYYLCSKRGQGFRKILVLLKKIKKVSHLNRIYRIRSSK